MKEIYIEKDSSGHEYRVDLKNCLFTIKNKDKEIFKMPLLAYKHNLFRNEKTNIYFDLKQAVSCTPEIYDKDIEKLLMKIEREG